MRCGVWVLVALVCGLVGAQAAFAASPPAVSWAKSVGGTSGDFATGVSILADGSAIITGSFAGATMTLGATTLTNAGTGTSDLFVAKVNADGSWAWATSFGGTGNDSAAYASVLPDGSAIIAGGFASATMTLGATTLTNASTGTSDVFVAKVNADGSSAWAKSIGGAGDDFAYGVSVLPDGSAIITGGFESASMTVGGTTLTNMGAINSDVFVAKVNAAGSWTWARSAVGGTVVCCGMATDSDAGTGVSVLPDGSAIITGLFASATMTLGGTTLTNASAQWGDVFVAKVSADGSWVWAISADGGGPDFGSNVAVAADGSAIVTGAFFSTITAGGTTLTTAGLYDAFVAKVRADGAWAWVVSVGSAGYDGAYGVSALSDGSAIVTGDFGEFAAATMVVGSTTLTNGDSLSSDAFVAKVGANGAWDWATSAGGAGSDSASGVSALPDGSAMITGVFAGASMTIGSTTLTNAGTGTSDLFVARYLDVPQAPSVPTVAVDKGAATVTVVPLVGVAVLSYQVNSDRGGKTCAIVVPATSCVVKGLAGGVAYRFQVTATNGAGTGVASPWSEPILSPVTPTRVSWSQPTQSVRVGQVLLATFTAAADSTYMITATPSTAGRGGARAAKVVRGTCRIKTKQQRRMARCTIRLQRPGRWLVSITPVRMGVTGTPSTTRVRVKRADARPAG